MKAPAIDRAEAPGHHFTAPAALAAAALGLAAVAYVMFGDYPPLPYPQWTTSLIVAAVVLAGFVALAGWSPTGLGLRLRPRQGWRWWVRVSILLGLGFAAVCAAALGVLYALDLMPDAEPPVVTSWTEEIVIGMVAAPVCEELVFRLGLAPPLARLLGPWPAILIIGTIFAAAHHGALAPTNALAGYLFTWSYLASGSLVIPIVFHAIGNGVVILAWALV